MGACEGVIRVSIGDLSFAPRLANPAEAGESFDSGFIAWLYYLVLGYYFFIRLFISSVYRVGFVEIKVLTLEYNPILS